MYLAAVIQTIILDHNPMKMQIETDDQSGNKVLFIGAMQWSSRGWGVLIANLMQN